jgi:hypothetical protein
LLLLQHRYLLVVLRCGDDEKEQTEMLKVDSEMQLATCFLPSQTNWEDSYGNEKGKQEVCKEVLEKIEQKGSQQEGSEEDDSQKIGQEDFLEEDGNEKVHKVNSTQESGEEVEQKVQLEEVQSVSR